MHRHSWGLPYVSLLGAIYSIWGTCRALYHTGQYCTTVDVLYYTSPFTTFAPFALSCRLPDTNTLPSLMITIISYISHCVYYNYYSRIIIIFYFRLYYHQILHSYHIISINTSLHLKYRFESYCWILRFKIFLNRSNLRDFLLRYK